jgi:hypothetical protein
LIPQIAAAADKAARSRLHFLDDVLQSNLTGLFELLLLKIAHKDFCVSDGPLTRFEQAFLSERIGQHNVILGSE